MLGSMSMLGFMTMVRRSVSQVIKLVINAGQAKPGPPVGAALGQAGLKIMEFVKDFNAKTADIKVREMNWSLCCACCTQLVTKTPTYVAGCRSGRLQFACDRKTAPLLLVHATLLARWSSRRINTRCLIPGPLVSDERFTFCI